jgi:hypothetical protein
MIFLHFTHPPSQGVQYRLIAADNPSEMRQLLVAQTGSVVNNPDK